MTSAAQPFNKRDQRDEKDERDDSEVVDNARQCGAHGSDNADTRPRSRPYRLSCPSRPKITRDERDERDNNEVGDHLSLLSLRLCVSVVSNFSASLLSLLSLKKSHAQAADKENARMGHTFMYFPFGQTIERPQMTPYHYKFPSFWFVSRIIFIVDSSSTKIEFRPCCSCAGSPV